MEKIWRKKMPGFTLIELSIVMIIVGIITAAVFKGQELIESARLNATAGEFHRYALAYHLYRDAFGHVPGNDPHAQERFGRGVANGDGQGLIRVDEQDQFWIHLSKYNGLTPAHAPQSKIGGFFSVCGNGHPELPGNWLILSGQKGTFQSTLTPKQAMGLKVKMGELEPHEGKVIILDGEGGRKGDCIHQGTYNLSHNKVACVAAMVF